MLQVFFLYLKRNEGVEVFHDESGFGEAVLDEFDLGNFVFGQDVPDVALEDRLPVRV